MLLLQIRDYLKIDKSKSEWPNWDPVQADKDVDIDCLFQALNGTRNAYEQVFSTFAFITTSAGIPMLLAGEGFGDLHDLDPKNRHLKTVDPVDFSRTELSGHKELLGRVKQLVQLRRRHKALQRNEVGFFGLNNGFHPSFDQNEGIRVFAYCRTGGQSLGPSNQVIAAANCGKHNFPSFIIEWPWGGMAVNESGSVNQALPTISNYKADIALKPYQVRIFYT